MPVSEPSNLYPVALDVRDRVCVVVGGGAVAVRKAVGLLQAGAIVRVVAPQIGDKMRELVAENCVPYFDEPFMPSHLDQAFLAVAATDQPEVNRAVGDAARERHVLVNFAATAGDDAGDFVTMATVRRGELLVAITTGGAGPALSARLKREFDERFGPEWEPYVALLREMRAEAKFRFADERERAEALRRLAADDSVLAYLSVGDDASARREALSCLS